MTKQQGPVGSSDFLFGDDLSIAQNIFGQLSPNCNREREKHAKEIRGAGAILPASKLNRS